MNKTTTKRWDLAAELCATVYAHLVSEGCTEAVAVVGDFVARCQELGATWREVSLTVREASAPAGTPEQAVEAARAGLAASEASGGERAIAAAQLSAAQAQPISI